MMRNLKQFGIGSAIFTLVMAVASIAKASNQRSVAMVSPDEVPAFEAVSLNHGAGSVQRLLHFAQEPVRKPSQKI